MSVIFQTLKKLRGATDTKKEQPQKKQRQNVYSYRRILFSPVTMLFLTIVIVGLIFGTIYGIEYYKEYAAQKKYQAKLAKEAQEAKKTQTHQIEDTDGNETAALQDEQTEAEAKDQPGDTQADNQADSNNDQSVDEPEITTNYTDLEQDDNGIRYIPPQKDQSLKEPTTASMHTNKPRSSDTQTHNPQAPRRNMDRVPVGLSKETARADNNSQTERQVQLQASDENNPGAGNKQVDVASAPNTPAPNTPENSEPKSPKQTASDQPSIYPSVFPPAKQDKTRMTENLPNDQTSSEKYVYHIPETKVIFLKQYPLTGKPPEPSEPAQEEAPQERQKDRVEQENQEQLAQQARQSVRTIRLVEAFKIAVMRKDNQAAKSFLMQLTDIKGPNDLYIAKLEAYWYLVEHKYDLAQKRLEYILAQNSEDLESGLNMAICEIKTANLSKARDRLLRLKELYPDNEKISRILNEINRVLQP